MLRANPSGAGTVSGFWIASYLRLDRPPQPVAMTDQARTKLAAGATALFVAGVGAAGLAVRDAQPQTPTAAPAPSVSTPVAEAPTRQDDDGAGAVLGALVDDAAGALGHDDDD